MATATMLPDLAVGLAETMADAFETRRVEEWTSEEVSAAIFACHFLRDLFAMARRSIEDSLSAGVEAKTFFAHYEDAVADLDAVLATVEQLVAQARTRHLPKLTEEFVLHYQAFGSDLASLRQFLTEALTKAKTRSRPIDWKRVQEVEAAYQRGETRPFQQLSEKQPEE